MSVGFLIFIHKLRVRFFRIPIDRTERAGKGRHRRMKAAVYGPIKKAGCIVGPRAGAVTITARRNQGRRGEVGALSGIFGGGRGFAGGLLALTGARAAGLFVFGRIDAEVAFDAAADAGGVAVDGERKVVALVA